MVARVVVSQYAPGGPVALRVTKDDATLGFVNVTVAKPSGVEPQPTPTSPKTQHASFDQLLASKKPIMDAPPFETSGKTPMIIN